MGCSPREMGAGIVSAADSGDTAAIQSCLNNGDDINERDPDTGDTPLIAAAARGRLDAIKLLVKHGANLKAHDNMGNGPLMTAIASNQPDAAVLLLDLGADPHDKGDYTMSPFALARSMSEEKVCTAIKKHGGE